MQRAPKYCAERDCLEIVPAGTIRCPTHTVISWSTTRRRPRGWRKTRERILTRDQWRCYVCGCRATEVDHIDNLGSDEDDNLAAICSDCHLRKTLAEARESQLTR
ncbi:HNH endonuclease signature motif containing protein [Mycobacterium sp. CSUR Q5927]|nr:HNH endonuclease signature motif containing protein [Mycobacterium sp. CSUR Q5927]